MFSRQKIPLFRDGRFLGSRSHSTIEALYVRGLIDLERNKRGYVVAAHERRVVTELAVEPAPSNTNSNALRPTLYSFEDCRIEGRPWDLKRLNGSRDGIHYAPDELRPIFLRVLMDCLT